MLYLISLGIAASVGLSVLAITNLLVASNRPSRSRMVELGLEGAFSRDAAARRGRVRSQLGDVLAHLGQKIDTPRRNWGSTRLRLSHAGYRHPSALPIYLGARIGAAGVLYLYGILIGIALGGTGGSTIGLGLLGSASGWIIPSFLLSRRVTKRQNEIQKALPDAVDLLVICVEAGLALSQAFQRVSVEMRHTSALFSEELSQMNLEIRAGTSREEALTGLADRTGVSDVRSLVTMLAQTERFGTSIADSLRIHAETMRSKRQQRAEEAAAKTTIKMVFPLALCIFPALFVVILGPALIQIIQIFSSMGG